MHRWYDGYCSKKVEIMQLIKYLDQRVSSLKYGYGSNSMGQKNCQEVKRSLSFTNKEKETKMGKALKVSRDTVESKATSKLHYQ